MFRPSPASFSRRRKRALDRTRRSRDSSGQSGPRRGFESLEDRRLLAVDPLAIPAWVAQGPGPITGGYTLGLADNPVSGAIQSVAVHPTDPNVVYVGTVNGGIWQSKNAQQVDPSNFSDRNVHWTPRTERFPSLSINSIVFDASDRNIVYAGTGTTSSANLGEGGTGLIRTLNGGADWESFPKSFFSDRRIVAMTSVTWGGEQVLLAATDDYQFSASPVRTHVPDRGSIFRSVNAHLPGEPTFKNASLLPGHADPANRRLPAGSVTSLQADPGTPGRVYAALYGLGIFRSDDAGLTWTQVNSGIPAADLTNSTAIKLAVSAAAGNPVYAGVLKYNAGTTEYELTDVYRSFKGSDGVDDNGVGGIDDPAETQWTGITPAGTPAANRPNIGGQGFSAKWSHFSLAAHPTDPQLAYIGGASYRIGSTFVGNLLEGNAAAGTWTLLVGAAVGTAGANGTAPHPDSRFMTFDNSGQLWQSDDGGLYRLMAPTDPANRRWVSANGDLQLTEFNSTTYDSVHNLVLGGAQDNGVSVQRATGQTRWQSLAGGDGQIVQTAIVPGATGATVEQYYGTQQFGTFFRRTIGPDGTVTVNNPGLSVIGAGANLPAADAVAGSRFTNPFVVNRFDPSRLLFGGQSVYESTDRGETLNQVLGLSSARISSLAYGGRIPDPSLPGEFIDNPHVAYAGTEFGSVFFRQSRGPNFVRTVYPGSGVLDLAVDPDDFHVAYVADNQNRVWGTTDAGASWTNVTGNLRLPLGTIEIVKSPAGTTLVAGGAGGVYRSVNPTATARWSELGQGLPNSIANDLLYDPTDDVLVVGTFGRGAWTLPNAQVASIQTAVLSAVGTSGQDVFLVRRVPSAPHLIELIVNGQSSGGFAETALERIVVEGLADADTLTVDSTLGPIQISEGIAFIAGGDAGDKLVLSGPTPAYKGGIANPLPATGDAFVVGTGYLGRLDLPAIQRVSHSGISQIQDLLGSPKSKQMSSLGTGLAAAGVAIQAGGFGDLAGLDGSLSTVLAGVNLLAPEGVSDPVGSPRPQLNAPTVGSDLLRQLFETGPGGFSLMSLRETLDEEALADPLQLRDALDALDAIDGNVVLTETPGEIFFDVQVHKSLAGDGRLQVSADVPGGAVELAGILSASADVDLHLRFGVDGEGFFIEPNAPGDAEFSIHHLNVAGSVTGAGRIGLLGVELTSGALTIDPGVRLEIKLHEPAAGNRDGRLRLDELDPSLGGIGAVQVLGVAGAPDVVLAGTFGVAANFPGMAAPFELLNAQIDVTWDDAANPGNVQLVARTGGGDDLLQFLNGTPQQIIDGLNQVCDFLDQYRHEPEFDREIPFTHGTTLGQLLDFKDAFRNKIVALLEDANGTATFSTVQELSLRLATSLGIDLADLGLTFDPATSDLTWHVAFEHAFDPQSMPLDFSVHAGTLASFSTSAQIDLAASAGLDLTFGVNLTDVITAGSLASDLFIRDASLTGSVQATASHIEASVQLAGLGAAIHDGSATAQGSISVAFVDPGSEASDGKISLQELADSLANLGAIAPAPAIAASGAFHLPVTADSFSLGGSQVDLAGVVDGTDQQVDFSLSLTVNDWQPVDFLTVPQLSIVLDPTGLTLDATADIAGIVGVRIQGDYDFGTSTYRLAADAPVDWPIVSSVDLHNVLFAVSNRNADGTAGATRVTAEADVRLFDTVDFTVLANVTADGAWAIARPSESWEPVPGLTVADPFVVASTYDFTFDFSTNEEVVPPPASLESHQRLIVAGINLLGTGRLPDGIPAIGGSEVQIAGSVGASLADLNVTAKIVLAQPWVLADVIQFEAIGLSITGEPSLTVFGDGRILHDRPGFAIPGLDEDILVGANLRLSTTELSGALYLRAPVHDVFGVSGLNIIEADVQVGISFAATPVPPPTVGFNFLVELPQFVQEVFALPPTLGAALKVSNVEPIFAMSVLDWQPFAVLGVDQLTIREGTFVVAPNGGTIGTRVFERGFSAAFDADLFGVDVTFKGQFDEPTKGIVLDAYVGAFDVAGVRISGPGPDGDFAAAADNGANFHAELSALPGVPGGLGFSGRVELPGETGSGQPAFVALAGNVDAHGLAIDGQIQNWHVVPQAIVVREALFALDLPFANPAAGSLAFDADLLLLGTQIVVAGQVGGQGVAFTGTLAGGDRRFSGVTVEEFTLSFSSVPANEHLFAEFKVDLPGTGGVIDVLGKFENNTLVLDAAVNSWQPVPGLVFAGTLHAAADLAATALDLDFDVRANVFGVSTRFVGALSAAPDGFDLFATATVELKFPGGKRIADLAATIDLGRNSPFFVSLAADFQLPGTRPADVLLQGGIGATGVSLLADVDHWTLVPGLSFDGSLDVDANLEASQVIVNVDVDTHLLGSHLGLKGRLLAGGPGGFDFDLTGNLRFHGPRAGFVDLDLDATVQTVTQNGHREYRLAFDGRLRALGGAVDVGVTADMTAGSGGWLLHVAADFDPPRFGFSVAGITMRLEFDAGADLTIGSDISDLALGLHGKLFVSASVKDLGSYSTTIGSLDVQLNVDTGIIKIPKARLKVHYSHGIPTGASWEDLNFKLGDPEEPETTVDARRIESKLALGQDVLEIRGQAAPETIEVRRVVLPTFNLDEIVVRATNGDDLWVTLLSTPTAGLGRIDIDAGAGNDTVDIGSNVLVPVTARGGLGADTIRGGGGPNTLYGGRGQSTGADDPPPGKSGGAKTGVFLPIGGLGAVTTDRGDVLVGGPGDDLLLGEGGDDILTGGGGADQLDGGGGIDILNGRLEVLGTDRRDNLNIARDRRLVLIDTALSRIGGISRLANISLLAGLPDLDGTIFLPADQPGEPVDDVLVRRANPDGSFVTLLRTARVNVASLLVDGKGGDDAILVDPLLTVPALLIGGAGRDSIASGGGPAEIHGGAGDDLLLGSPAGDSIFGEEGDDYLDGRGGADLLDGGPGNNTIVGVTPPPPAGDNAPPNVDPIPNYTVEEETPLTFTVLAGNGGGAPPPPPPPPAPGGPAVTMVRDIAVGTDGSFPRPVAEIDGVMYFIGQDADHGQELWKTDGTEAGTVLVKDIVPGPNSAIGGPFYVLGNTLYFNANEGVHGWELWKSDGTEAGTSLVADITPGAGLGFGVIGMSALNGILYFSAGNAATGSELWRTDGTETGTQLVKDILPGSGSSFPDQFITVGGTLYFLANDGVHGNELWKSDGTEAGTMLVKDIETRTTGGATSLIGNMTAFGGTLYFTAEDGTVGWEVWKSDGTEAGTVPLLDVYPGRSGPFFTPNDARPQELTVVGGTMYFTAWSDEAGVVERRLWKTNGTAAGTVLVDALDGPFQTHSLIEAGGILYFFADSPATGFELWRTDGTADNTGLVKDINPGVGDSGRTTRGIAPVAVGNLVYFVAGDTSDSSGYPINNELWQSDGTPAGTVKVHDFASNDAAATNYLNPSNLIAALGTLFFAVDDGVHGEELWRLAPAAPPAPGGPAVAIVRDIVAGPDGSNPYPAVEMNGFLFFIATDPTLGQELWKTDGTAAGTTIVKDIGPGTTGGAGSPINVMGNVLYFIGSDGVHGDELWRTDGTEAGTSMVADVNNAFPSFERGILNGVLYFGAGDNTTGHELWRTDGTAAGTYLLKDISPGLNGSSQPRQFTAAGGVLYFTANDGVHGNELWKTDGTEAGTVMVKDIETRTDGGRRSEVAGLTNFGGTLFFTASNSTVGNELWKSDGTEAGTVVVKDVYGGLGGSFPNQFPNSAGPAGLTVVGNTLFFAASSIVNGTVARRLWKTDGTAAGTVLVDMVDSPLNPTPVIAAGDTLYFFADMPATGVELWKSDGTEEGTMLVMDINPGADDSWPGPWPVALGNLLYFVAGDRSDSSGYPMNNELWLTDGTPDGTRQVSDFPFNDAARLAPGSLKAALGTVFFVIDDGTHGNELWRLTPAATTAVFDAAADYSSTNNPTGPWSYGWTDVRGGTFTLYPAVDASGPVTAWTDPSITSLGAPNVFHNASSIVQNVPATLEPGALAFHPGNLGQNSVVRWTAPQDGRFRVQARFEGIHGTTTDVTVLIDRGGSELDQAFEGLIEEFGDFETFEIDVDMLADRTIDFSVGFGFGNFFSDSTELDAVITRLDPPTPTQQLTFALEPGAPAGATIDPATGLFAWTPGPEDGPGAYPVTVRVTDDGAPPRTSMQTFTVTVTDANDAPQLAPIDDLTAAQLTVVRLVVAATDADVPAQSLTFGLDDGAPPGARIDAATGVFTWRPTLRTAPGDYDITVRVTDGGSPALAATETFRIVLTDAPLVGTVEPLAGVVSRNADGAVEYAAGDLFNHVDRFTFLSEGDGERNVNTAVIVTEPFRIVSDYYETLLGRVPDDQEAVDQANVAPRQGFERIVDGIFDSPEFLQDTVSDIYVALLGRPADETGGQFWLRQLQAGRTRDDVLRTFLTSDEYFFALHGSSPAAFVTALYADVLHRAAGRAEVDYWQGQFDAGVTREQVVDRFLLSVEYQRLAVQQWYSDYLLREADAEGLAFWTARLAAGQAAEEIQTQLLVSDEFRGELRLQRRTAR